MEPSEALNRLLQLEQMVTRLQQENDNHHQVEAQLRQMIDQLTGVVANIRPGNGRSMSDPKVLAPDKFGSKQGLT